jgi:hypothetical protein
MSLVAAPVALAILAGVALGFWTAPGAGGATAAAGTLTAPAISTPAAATGSVTVTWTAQAALSPAGTGAITYRVERRLGAGAFAAVTTGACSGTLPHGTASCVDAPPTSGSYSYRVVAAMNSWTATSAIAGPVTVTVDSTAPTVTSIARVGSTPTAASSVSWTVTFSESVTGVNASDFSLVRSGGLTGGSITAVTGSGTTRTVTASTGSGSGTLGLNLVDDDTIEDTAFVPNPLGGTGAGNGNATGQVYTFDRTAPTVSSIALAGRTPTAAASVSWTVTFSESVTGVDAADFTLVRTGSVTGGSITAVTGSGATRTVTAGTGSGSGTLGLNLVDNDTIVDALSNRLGGTGANNGNFTGATYTLDRTAPALTSLQMLDNNANGKVDRVTATFNETLASTTATAPWTLANVPSGGTLSTVSTSGTSVTLTVSEGAGAASTAVGSFTVALAANAAGVRDALGNQSSFAATAPLDRAGPVPTAMSDTNGLINGRLEQNNTLIITFSEAIAGGVQTPTTITETRPASGNATLSIPGVTNGALGLGSADYLISQGSVITAASVALSADSRTLTITAGACSSGCLLVGTGTGTTMVYVPAATLVDGAANPATGSRAAGFAIF